MSPLDLLFLAAAPLGAVALTGAVVLGARRRPAQRAVPVPVRAVVRVIRDDEQLREAVERAARFEEQIARTVQSRTDRYDAMVGRRRA